MGSGRMRVEDVNRGGMITSYLMPALDYLSTSCLLEQLKNVHAMLPEIVYRSEEWNGKRHVEYLCVILM